MSTVIVGIGNPVLTDDSVGIHAAAMIRASLPPHLNVTVREVYAGGMRLMDAMTGFDRAIVIDAVSTGQHPAGTIVRLDLHDLRQTRNTVSMHDMDLPTALDFAASVGMKVPREVEVWGVEISDASTFGEYPCPVVRAALPRVVSEICQSAQRSTAPAHEEVLG
jgi:hydrogenase maturation protease